MNRKVSKVTARAGVIAATITALSTASWVWAQSPTSSTPHDDSAPISTIEYRSAFNGYQPQRNLELQSWRDVNDEMGRLGGHVGHVQETAPSATGTSPAEEKR